MSKQQSRQGDIIQISKKVFYCPRMAEINMDDANDSKKEEIYESGGQEDEEFNILQNYPKSSKREPKLFGFLAKINEAFEAEMQQFLLRHKEEFQGQGQKPAITLYEDIMIIWAFKKAENELRKKKKVQMDKLTKELEQTIKRKQTTIRERIEKKLANLGIEEIRFMMKTNQDLSFGDKKQLVIKNPSAPNVSKSHLSNEEPLNDVKANLKPVVANIKTVVEQVLQKKKEVPVPVSMPVNRFESKLRQIEKKQQKIEATGQLYKYGRRQSNEPIKIMYNPKNKSIFAFKKSQFENMSKGEKKIELTTSEVIFSEDKIESKVDSKNVSGESIVEVMVNSPIKIRKAQAEQINQYLQNQRVLEDPEYLQQHIKKVKSQTQKTIDDLESGKKTPQVTKTIEELKNKLLSISELQQKMHPKLSNSVKKEGQKLEKVVPPYESDIDSQSNNSSRMNRRVSKNSSTGKKTLLPDDQPNERPERHLNLEMSEKDTEEQKKKVMKMLCDNANYFQIIQKHPDRWNMYAWSEDEDQLLFNFIFSPNSYRAHMICMLRYKPQNMVLERCRYLKVDENLVKALYKLRSENRVTEEENHSQVNVEKKVQELMDIEVRPQKENMQIGVMSTQKLMDIEVRPQQVKNQQIKEVQIIQIKEKESKPVEQN